MQPTICFVTTGDISINATAKRALGMAAPLVQRGWAVTILLEDTTENRHRAEIECAGAANVIFFTQHSALDFQKGPVFARKNCFWLNTQWEPWCLVNRPKENLSTAPCPPGPKLVQRGNA